MIEQSLMSLVMPEHGQQLNLYYEVRFYVWRHVGGLEVNPRTTSKIKALEWARQHYPNAKIFVNQQYLGTWEEVPLVCTQ